MFEHEPMFYQNQEAVLAHWNDWSADQAGRQAIERATKELKLPASAKGWVLYLMALRPDNGISIKLLHSNKIVFALCPELHFGLKKVHKVKYYRC